MLALLVACADPDAPTDPASADCGDAVATTTGCLAGTVLPSGREAFLGVPFAEPPTGALRFAGTVPKTPWAGVLEATASGPPCVQFEDAVTGDLFAGDGAEDCLTLDVYRPSGAAGLPILFFVHGGGHVSGAASQEVYADDPLLAEGAVLVNTQYRLGPLGFLAHPALSAEDRDGVSGNGGFRDVLTALEWVHANAAALGGDPDRVLVFGESAGGLETCAVITSPQAEGLFTAAAIESAACGFVQTPLRDGFLGLDAETQGEDFASEVGCDGADPAPCLRGLDLETLVEIGRVEITAAADGWSWGPSLDGVWLPADPLGEVLARGDWARVPVLATVNADEGWLFTVGLAPNQAALDGWVSSFALVAGVPAAEVAAQYDPALYGGSTEDAFSALYGDAIFVCPAVFQQEALAGQVDALGGFFTHPLAPLGAIHGAELAYVFGTYTAFASDEELALSARMRAAWTSLVDAPAVPDLGPWPAAPAEWVRFDVGAPEVVGPPRAAECELWRGSRLDPYPR